MKLRSLGTSSWGLALIVTIAVSAAPAFGSDRSHARLIGEQHGRGFASDGARYVAFNATRAKIRVFDGKTGKTFSIRSRCPVVAGAAAHFLLDCATPSGSAPSPSLLDVRTRAIAPVPNAQTPYDGFYGIGAHWLQGDTYHADAPDRSYLLYLNWRTGQRVELPREQEQAPDRDIDTRGLAKIGGIPFKTYFLFGHESSLSAVRPTQPAGGTPNAAGNLQLVGRGRRVVLSRNACGSDCGVVTRLDGGRVAWAEPAKKGMRVRAYSLRHKRRGAWSVGGFPKADVRSRRVQVGLTRRYVVCAKLVKSGFDPATDDYTASQYNVYAVRW